MVRKREEIEGLIALFLSGESSPDQAMDLEIWRSESEENQALFDSYEKTFNATHGRIGFVSPDIDAAWRKVKASVKEEPKVVPLYKNRNFYMSVAALAVVAFVVGSIWNFNPEYELLPNATAPRVNIDTVETEQIIYAANNVESLTLSDQSIVELKKGSRLILSKDFNKNGRYAELEGSGSFTVVHDATNPFVITVEDLEVFDLGTVFDIETKGDTVSVVVSEGEVELRLNGKTIALAKGDSAYYVISEKLIERYKTPKDRLDKIFVFDGTSLSQVMQQIGEFFERDIVIKDDVIKGCKVNIEFKDETLPMIFDILQTIVEFEIVYNNEIIELYGDGCK
ncbi:MAG: ferric-dicitrate binding protein FerR (iron transport regulator) [Salibacteraceae bacterium]|jgi:ferric-dicitrate binding protein FerR (iron transport regulator)